MRSVSRALWQAFFCLSVPALLTTLILYNYPIVYGCGFPEPTPSRDQKDSASSPLSSSPDVAPFRLLALGDPQLEGDSSLPDPNASLLPSLRRLWRRDYTDYSRGFPTEKPTALTVVKDLVLQDIPTLAWSLRKRLDLFGNDYYLAHIYRSLNYWTEPTHVTVLGDLIGSQWVSDDEFERRRVRYWDRVFKSGQRVENELMDGKLVDPGSESKTWRKRIINVAGNHDIGYAGDITKDRIMRFEQAYGKVNWDVTFNFATTSLNSTSIPSIRLIVLNNMNLDGPGYDASLMTETYNFLNEQIIRKSSPVEDGSAATILLTHIPLTKEQGVCVDGPWFDYGATGLREQNHLSQGASIPILEGIFGMHRDHTAANGGMGRNGVILTGHDHEGCDVYHYFPRNTSGTAPSWTAKKYSEANTEVNDPHTPGIREITVRSMMGSYSGNAGLLSGWYDEADSEWHFAYTTCALGVQHIWWAVHALGLMAWLVLGAALLASMLERDSMPGARKRYVRDPGVGTETTTQQEAAIKGREETRRKEKRKQKERERASVRQALAEDLADEKVYAKEGTLTTGYETGAPMPRSVRTRMA